MSATSIHKIENLLHRKAYWPAYYETLVALEDQELDLSARTRLLKLALKACVRLRNLLDAEPIVQNILELGNIDKTTAIESAAFYSHTKNVKKANALLRRSIKDFGPCNVSLSELGLLQIDCGNLTKAQEILDKVFSTARKNKRLDHSDERAVSRLAELRDFDTREISFLTSEFDKNKRNNLGRDIAFTLAKTYRFKKEIDDEIRWLQVANQTAFSLEKRSPSCWTPERAHRRAELIYKLYPLPKPTWLNSESHDKQLIFVLGMPRSGTTLVDQLISRHPKIGSTGESRGFNVELIKICIEKNIRPKHICPTLSDLDSITQMDNRDLLGLAHQYVKYQSLIDDHSIVLDKNLGMVDQVGLLANLFPNAQFVYVKRQILDNCVSLLQQCLNNAAFSTKADWCVIENRIYQQKMEHWMSLFPDRIVSLHYEELVADKDGVMQGLFKSLGHNSINEPLIENSKQSFVQTPSSVQVRKKISTDQIDKSQKYSPLIESALQELGYSNRR